MRGVHMPFIKRLLLAALLVMAGWISCVVAGLAPQEIKQFEPDAIADKQEKQENESSWAGERQGGRIMVETGLMTTYDSNVFYYSRDEIDEFDAGSYTNDRFTHIKSVSDVIASPGINLAYKDFFCGHTFKSGVAVTPHFYAHNKVKDYEDYEFYLRQYLNKGEFVEFNYGKRPDYMESNFYDRDDALYKKANYAEDRLLLGYSKPFARAMSAMAQYFYVNDDYNDNFKEYDMQSNAVRLYLRKAFTDKFIGRIYGEYAYEDARGDMDGTARVESDPSRQIWKVNLRGTYDVTSKLQMYVQYGIWFIDYTTGNSITDDPYHAQRDDIFQNINYNMTYDLTKNIDAFLAYHYAIKDANLESKDSSVLDAGILGYERHQVSFGVKYAF